MFFLFLFFRFVAQPRAVSIGKRSNQIASDLFVVIEAAVGSVIRDMMQKGPCVKK